MDARWVDVEDALARSVHHFRMAALMFERHKDLLVLEPESERAYEAKMALMHAVQSGYVSFEGMLKRILHLLGEDVPGGPSSHADLLQRVGKRLRLPGQERPPILGEHVVGLADKVRKFRHRAIYSYDDFDPGRAVQVFDACRGLADLLPAEILSFREQVDPGAPGPVP